MKKIITTLILVSFLLLISLSTQAETVEEILIVGLSRTEETVVKNQLPFSEGDEWKEEYRSWTLNRLSDMGIFSYRPQRIIVENVSGDKVRVIIRLADPSVLYIEPAEYAVSNLTMLPAKWFRQNIYNYSGKGERVWFNINWDRNYSYEMGGTLPVKSGLSSLNLEYYKNERKSYFEKGYLIEADYRYWYNAKIFQQFKLAYQNGDFNYDGQEIILPETSIFWQDTFSLGAIMQSGINMSEDNNFARIEGIFHKKDLPWNMILRCGTLSTDTPENHYYYLGGAGELPLRAEGYKRKAASYLMGSIEHRFKLTSPLKPILFADGAVYKKDLDSGWEKTINLGIAVTVDTPLDIPLRFDFAYNPESADSSFRFNFGHSVWFNRAN